MYPEPLVDVAKTSLAPSADMATACPHTKLFNKAQVAPESVDVKRPPP